MALAQAGIPMKSLVSSVSIGKLDKQLVTDLIKAEEDWEEGEGPTDIPITLTGDGKISHIQLDGKISMKQIREAVTLAEGAYKEIHAAQEKALKEVGEEK
jgi:exosome complex component RRP41